MSTFIIHERQQFRRDGKVRRTGRAYCKCGGSMSISTDNARLYETAITAFIENHEGEDCGDTDPATCRRMRAKKEREAVSAHSSR